MYLSQLILDVQVRRVQQDLSDSYQLHRTVMMGFPQELSKDERVLYRLELQRSYPQVSILVQSFTFPNWQALDQQGYLLRPAIVKAFEFQPDLGQVFQFRLAANPTKRLRTKSDDVKGARIGLFCEEDQLAWLERKSELHGFKVLAVQTVRMIQPDGWKSEDGKNRRIRQQGVRFEGHLQVTQAEAFTRALKEGIGSGKGFGFGLLSLAAS